MHMHMHGFAGADGDDSLAACVSVLLQRLSMRRANRHLFHIADLRRTLQVLVHALATAPAAPKVRRAALAQSSKPADRLQTAAQARPWSSPSDGKVRMAPLSTRTAPASTSSRCQIDPQTGKSLESAWLASHVAVLSQ